VKKNYKFVFNEKSCLVFFNYYFMWFIYIIRCCDGTLYTGITNNLKRRLKEHNSENFGAKYTRGRQPVELVYSTKRKGRSSALKEEFRIKKLKRIDKIKLIKK